MNVATAIVQSAEAEQNVINQFYQIFLGRPAEETQVLISGFSLLAGDQGGQLGSRTNSADFGGVF